MVDSIYNYFQSYSFDFPSKKKLFIWFIKKKLFI